VNRICIAIICCFFLGCASLLSDAGKPLTNMRQTSAGMSKKEVVQIMGDTVTIGYAVINDSGATRPITVINPQKVKTVTRRGRVYEVLFYLTHVRQSEGNITDDELTPFVFENEKFLGHGWYFLNKILRKK